MNLHLRREEHQAIADRVTDRLEWAQRCYGPKPVPSLEITESEARALMLVYGGRGRMIDAQQGTPNTLMGVPLVIVRDQCSS